MLLEVIAVKNVQCTTIDFLIMGLNFNILLSRFDDIVLVLMILLLSLLKVLIIIVLFMALPNLTQFI